MKSLFLSHSHADKKFVRKLAKDLQDRGIYIWLDEAEIKVGDSLIQKIREGIDRVDYVGVVLSPASVKSEWVAKEVDVAMNHEIAGRKVKVLPILIESCELPSFLTGKLYADFRRSYSRGLKALFNRLEVKEVIGPHQPIIRSLEISVSSKTLDQVPQAAKKDDVLFIQWIESGEDVDIIYIYTIDLNRFQLLDCFFYTVPPDVIQHWLVISDNTVGSFALSGIPIAPELWYTQISHSGPIVPRKISWPNAWIGSVIAVPDGFLACSLREGQLEVVEISTTGSIRRKRSRQIPHHPTYSSLIKLHRNGVLLQTTRGVELSTIGANLIINTPKLLIQASSEIIDPVDTQIRFYDYCADTDGVNTCIIYHRKTVAGQDIDMSIVSRQGRVIKSITAVSNSEPTQHIFKPSLGISAKSILAVWNVGQIVSSSETQSNRMYLLNCMLFDKVTLKPLLPYERTLTSGSNSTGGVPVILYKDNHYVIYQEDSLARFKIKISEINLKDLPA